jgi:hypothetical protein
MADKAQDKLAIIKDSRGNIMKPDVRRDETTMGIE